MKALVHLISVVFWVVGALICIFAVLALFIPALVSGGAERFLLLAGVLFLGALAGTAIAGVVP